MEVDNDWEIMTKQGRNQSILIGLWLQYPDPERVKNLTASFRYYNMTKEAFKQAIQSFDMLLNKCKKSADERQVALVHWETRTHECAFCVIARAVSDRNISPCFACPLKILGLWPCYNNRWYVLLQRLALVPKGEDIPKELCLQGIQETKLMLIKGYKCYIQTYKKQRKNKCCIYRNLKKQR